MSPGAVSIITFHPAAVSMPLGELPMKKCRKMPLKCMASFGIDDVTAANDVMESVTNG